MDKPTPKKRPGRPRTGRTVWKLCRIPETPENMALLRRAERLLLARSGLATGSLPFHVVVMSVLKEWTKATATEND